MEISWLCFSVRACVPNCTDATNEILDLLRLRTVSPFVKKTPLGSTGQVKLWSPLLLLGVAVPSSQRVVLLSPPPPLVWCCFHLPPVGGGAFSLLLWAGTTPPRWRPSSESCCPSSHLFRLSKTCGLHLTTFPVADVFEHARENDPVWKSVGFVPNFQHE